MAGFLGLHVDVKRIFADNMQKPGLRKYGCVRINEGDKITPEEKAALKQENRKTYGLSEEYIKYLNELHVPKQSKIKIYDISKIVNSRKSMGISEKIELLLNIKRALLGRLEQIRNLADGETIKDFGYMEPDEFEDWFRHKRA